MAGSFNTSNKSFREIFASGLSYQVPRFQRDYSWSQDEWDDLWRDIEDLFREDAESDHYMGYLVLQTRDSRSFDVVDGQQRLATLSLLVLAVLRTLDDIAKDGHDSEDNKRRMSQYHSIYIGDLNPVTLVARPKLTLNRNNDEFYKDYLVPLRTHQPAGLRASEKALQKAFEWFYKMVSERLRKFHDGAKCAEFLEAISDKLFFTVITVRDELNAFKVFETLNARGVRLSPTDLLKNHLFSVVYSEGLHSEEMDALERRWQGIVNRLGSDSFPDFLRAHWNSSHRLIRHSELFKTIRSGTRSGSDVFELLRNLEEDVETYAALSFPEGPQWDVEQRPLVADLRMFGVRQHWPYLLAARRRFEGAALTQILRACVTIAFRYNVIGGLHTNLQETTFSAAAQGISSGKFTSPNEAIRALKDVYVSDESFRAAFSEKELPTTTARNRKVVRYILFQIERKAGNHTLDPDSAQYTLEHVLPQHPAESEWNHFGEKHADAFVFRLGNLTVLEANLNREIGNRTFKEKKDTLVQSGVVITRLIAEENSEWSPERLSYRQRWMAEQATAIWRISQMD